MELEPRIVGLLSVLAFLPIGLYAAGRMWLTTPAMIITFVNVVLIVTSIFLLFGPSPGGDHDHSGTAQ